MKTTKSLLLSLFLIFAISLNTLAQVDESHFDYMDVFDLQMVASPEISPMEIPLSTNGISMM